MRGRPDSIDAGGAAGVLALGAALLAAAVLFGAEQLYVPAVALLLLALFAAAWVALGALGARVHRRLDAPRVIEGEPLRARVDARAGPLGLRGATLREPLLERPRALPQAREAHLRVEARFERRGRRELAPPALLFADPLGLLTVRRAEAGPAGSVLVLPRVEPVLAGRDAPAGDGIRAGRRVAGAGAEVEIDGLRPARPGTPASRIHWPALARGAGLLERRMLPEADARPLVVLDPRGGGEDGADAAVRATASLAVHLAHRGGCALLLPGDRRPAALDAALHGWAALHVRLALLDAAAPPPPGALNGRRGPVVLVVAHVPERLPRALSASGAPQRLLVVPGALPGRRAAFTVAGCRGYELARAPVGAQAA